VDKFNLADTFVVLSPGKVAGTVTNTPTVFEDLDREYGDFNGHELIALFEFREDWPSWEVHPKGDEIVVLLSGRATFVLNLDSGKREISLGQPGDSVIVPRGVWHTARIETPTRMLFITPGEGTLNEYDKARFD
jgi:mannose-6-phosphate isomerase-like protein (cupin superfamily)